MAETETGGRAGGVADRLMSWSSTQDVSVDWVRQAYKAGRSSVALGVQGEPGRVYLWDCPALWGSSRLLGETTVLRHQFSQLL